MAPRNSKKGFVRRQYMTATPATKIPSGPERSRPSPNASLPPRPIRRAAIGRPVQARRVVRRHRRRPFSDEGRATRRSRTRWGRAWPGANFTTKNRTEREIRRGGAGSIHWMGGRFVCLMRGYGNGVFLCSWASRAALRCVV